jgi:hypothetical protein
MRVCDVAAQENTRYAFRGTKVERNKDGTCTATATDGRRLLSVTWTEDTTAPLPGFEEVEKPKEGFAAVIPARAAMRADSAIRRVRAKKNSRPAPACVVIDEQNANGRVQLITLDDEGTQRLDVAANEGQYPPFKDVIPNHKIVTDDREKWTKKSRAVRIGVKADLLAGLLDAMKAAVPDAEGVVVLEVPTVPSRPIKMTIGKDDARRRAVGVLMPVNLNL